MRHLNLTAAALLAVTAIAATQCTSRNSGNTASAFTGTVTIAISDTLYNPAEWFDKTERIELLTDSTTFLGYPWDICVNDSSIYILDRRLAVTAFERATGRMTHRLEAKGQGPGEYANLISMDLRGDSLYLLDQYMMKVLVYDSGLNFHRQIDLGFPAIDLAKTDDGFVFSTTPHEPGKNQITLTDNDGHVTGGYLPLASDNMIGVFSGHNILNANSRGELYFELSFAPEVYRLTPDSLELFAIIDLKDDAGSTLTVDEFMETNLTKNYINKVFVTDSTIMVEYLADRIQHICLLDLTTGESVDGKCRFDYARPFSPGFQSGNMLITYLHAQDFVDIEEMHFDNPDAEGVVFIHTR